MSRIATKGRAAFYISIVLLLAVSAVGGFAEAAPPPPVCGTIVSISGTK